MTENTMNGVYEPTEQDCVRDLVMAGNAIVHEREEIAAGRHTRAGTWVMISETSYEQLKKALLNLPL